MNLLNDPTIDPLVDAGTKGIPAKVGRIRLSDIAAQNWNLLAGDCPLPLAVIRSDALENNCAWMANFARLNDLQLAPHVKTTMAPALFTRQLSMGAWALTVATTQQLKICTQMGVARIILANQPVGQAVDACFRAVSENPQLELYVLADSLAGVELLAAAATHYPHGKSLRVLVEVGAVGGRTGCRSVADATAVASAIARAPGLQLAGVEAFEGVLPDEAAVASFLTEVAAAAKAIDERGLFQDDIVLSAGGSAFFDLVALNFRSLKFSRPVVKVLRSGCYVTHDMLGYAEALTRVFGDRLVALPEGSLKPALAIWTYIQSRPDPGRALLTMGKRDVGYDSGLPVPISWYRPGAAAPPQPLPLGHLIEALNDQHAYLKIPAQSPLSVGDMIEVGISHPCTTFERWRVIMLIDRLFNVVGAFQTFF